MADTPTKHSTILYVLVGILFILMALFVLLYKFSGAFRGWMNS